MSEFTDALEEGFSEVREQCGTPIKCGAVTKIGIVSQFVLTEEMRDSGTWEGITCTAELARPDFTSLALDNRSEVTIAGRRLKVMVIEDDAVDATVRVHLRPAR